MQRTIDVPEEQVQELEQLAAEERRSLDEVVQWALSDYLARRHGGAEWGRRLAAALERLGANAPADIPPEEIEADITAARAEVRAERAARRAAGEARAGGR